MAAVVVVVCELSGILIIFELDQFKYFKMCQTKIRYILVEGQIKFKISMNN